MDSFLSKARLQIMVVNQNVLYIHFFFIYFFFLYIYISLFPHLKIVLGTWCRVNGVWKPLTKTFTYRQHRTGCLIVVFTNHIYNTPHFKIFEITETSFFSDVEYTFIYVYMFFKKKKKKKKNK